MLFYMLIETKIGNNRSVFRNFNKFSQILHLSYNKVIHLIFIFIFNI